MTKNIIKPKDSDQLNLRTTITISNINQLSYTSTSSSLSFRYIWNHILVMLQHPLSFMIFDKDNSGNYRRIITLNKDPLSTKRFDELLREKDLVASYNEDDIAQAYYNFNKTELNRYLFPIFNTPYSILLFSVYNPTSNIKMVRDLQPIFNSEKEYQCSDDDPEKYQKKKLFRVVEQVNDFFSLPAKRQQKASLKVQHFFDFLSSTIRESADVGENQAIKDYSPYGLEDDNDPESKITAEKSLKIYKKVLLKEESRVQELVPDEIRAIDFEKEEFRFKEHGYLDRIYRKVKSGLRSLQGGSVPNLSLYMSDCVSSPSLPRCDGQYNYGLGLYLVDEQKEKIIQYFDEIRPLCEEYSMIKDDISRKEKTSHLFYSQLNKDICGGNESNKNEVIRKDKENKVLQQCLNMADDWFWDNIKDGNKNAIIEVLEAPFGKKLRSVCDATFFNGTCHVAYPYLDGGGIKRCLGGAVDTKIPSEFSDIDSDCIADMKKMCATYYYFRGMMTQEEIETLDGNPELVNQITLLLVPMEVQGVILAACTHYIFIPHDDLDDNQWYKMIEIYNAVDQKVQRSLRKAMKELYMEIVNSIFVYNYSNMFMCLKKGVVNLGLMETMMNNGFQSVEYLMPFKTVRLKLNYAEDEVISEERVDDKTLRSRQGQFSFFPGVDSVIATVDLVDNKRFRYTLSSDRMFLKPEEVAFSFYQRAQQVLINVGHNK